MLLSFLNMFYSLYSYNVFLSLFVFIIFPRIIYFDQSPHAPLSTRGRLLNYSQVCHEIEYWYSCPNDFGDPLTHHLGHPQVKICPWPLEDILKTVMKARMSLRFKDILHIHGWWGSWVSTTTTTKFTGQSPEQLLSRLS